MARAPRSPFGGDPLAALARHHATVGALFWLPPGELWVGDPAAARDVLANREGNYREHSDFFFSNSGVLGPRAAQVAIGRAARELLRAEIHRRADALADLVVDRLGGESHWPDAGNRLLLDHLGAALVAPERPAALHALLDQVVDRAVLAGARQRHGALSRLLFRSRVHRELRAAFRDSRATATATATAGADRDLIDVVARHSAPSTAPGRLVDAYLSFVFATVGSIGFALGWAVYLLGTEPVAREDQPGWIVREALRLWPVAWLFHRAPVREHRLGSVSVGPADRVNVCAYLVHRHPGHWADPVRFHPGRWADPPREPAFLPFGHGPHACVGAGLSLALLTEIVARLRAYPWLRVTPTGDRSALGPALVPPRFTLALPKGQERVPSVRRR